MVIRTETNKVKIHIETKENITSGILIELMKHIGTTAAIVGEEAEDLIIYVEPGGFSPETAPNYRDKYKELIK